VELALTRRGLKPSSIATLKRNQTDLGATVSDVVKAEPDVVIATTLYKTTGDFIKSARKRISAQFASTSFVGASALANELGDQARRRRCAGVRLRQASIPSYGNTSGNREITRQKEYSFTSLESYIGAKVLVEAIRRAGANPTREGFSRRSIRCRTSMSADIWSISARRTQRSRFVELTASAKPEGLRTSVAADQFRRSSALRTSSSPTLFEATRPDLVGTPKIFRLAPRCVHDQRSDLHFESRLPCRRAGRFRCPA